MWPPWARRSVRPLMCIISKYKSYFTDEKMEAEGGKTEQLVIAGGGGH